MQNELSLHDLTELVQEHRQQLGDEFFSKLEIDLQAFAHGIDPTATRNRGPRREKSKLAAAALSEVHRLLCTSDSEYKILRRRAAGLSEKAIWALAGVISGKQGIPFAMASGAVALVLLTICKVGRNTFCRLFSVVERKRKS